MEIQQSELYSQYIAHLGWDVLTVDSVQIYLKHIPFFGVLAKIQRPEKLPYLPLLIPILRKHHVSSVAIEPSTEMSQEELNRFIGSLSKFFRISSDTFLPTKTSIIDISLPEDELFHSFSEAKRRAVRRAIKNSVLVTESGSIQDLIAIKNKSAGFLGGITTYGIDILWNYFAPKNATILLASYKTTVVGGVLLVFHDTISSYWIAGATKQGKKLFAPTLLVWEAIKASKQKGAKKFDFVGVFDERTPKKFTSWHGFTKFKEGFNGTTVYYPLVQK